VFREDMQSQRAGEDYLHIYDYAVKGELGTGKIKDLPCALCKDYMTVINVDLTEHHDMVCFGDRNCYKKTFEAPSSGGSPEGKKETASKDHGPEFQDRFYREAIRQRTTTMGFEDVRMLRLIAFALIRKDYKLEAEFCDAVGVAHYYQEAYKMWSALEKMPLDDIIVWITRSALFLTLDNMPVSVIHQDHTLKYKHLIAKHFGIDLARDWRITKDYLQCKTIREIVALGKDLKIFDTPEVKAFAQGKLKMKSENWAGMKKKDLIRLFLESGLDLAGKVPKEILKVK
jgi:ParB family transcriptional regulator, chromosome partitioning protein